jgi:hypothetical protein
MTDERLENPGECDSCGFVTKRLKRYELDTTLAGGGLVRRGVPFWFCALCASTKAGNAHCYPSHYPDGSTMATVCYLGNALLEALKGRK